MTIDFSTRSISNKMKFYPNNFERRKVKFCFVVDGSDLRVSSFLLGSFNFDNYKPCYRVIETNVDQCAP